MAEIISQIKTEYSLTDNKIFLIASSGAIIMATNKQDLDKVKSSLDRQLICFFRNPKVS